MGTDLHLSYQPNMLLRFAESNYRHMKPVNSSVISWLLELNYVKYLMSELNLLIRAVMSLRTFFHSRRH